MRTLSLQDVQANLDEIREQWNESHPGYHRDPERLTMDDLDRGEEELLFEAVASLHFSGRA